MRKILVAGNWKMHGSKSMVRSLLDGLLAGSSAQGKADLAVFPSFPYLSLAESILSGSHIQWGGQTLNPNAQGAHTGETSGNMLVDMGCRYVLVGHSERRSIYGESDEDVATRFKAAQDAGQLFLLKPVSRQVFYPSARPALQMPALRQQPPSL